jgi:IS30 family transposase
MANVLNEENKQQVLALGRLGWPLRQIQKAIHIRRETASRYLKARRDWGAPARWLGRREAKPANEFYERWRRRSSCELLGGGNPIS